ncbi:MAG: hypothetical protein KAR42_10305 [candidate division Zixibacteria bacterium]|nr:hypothetical protein [candidate division Zixibacteria bacterium]
MSLKHILLVLFSLSLIFTLAGCSDDDTPTSSGGDTTTTGIGPAGGTIQIAGSVSLVIPPGALPDTIDFTITTNGSPAAMSGTTGPVSPCFTIEPSGTNFTSPATITINYNPALVANAGEQTVGLYTDNGPGWVLLTTIRDTVNNTVIGPVSHLSDFTAGGDTTQASGSGIFAEFVAGRTIFTDPVFMLFDAYIARLDSAYAPCNPLQPISGATITCNDSTLYWVSQGNQYTTAGMGLVAPGASYTFTVTAGNGIPALTQSITFPTSQTQLSSPANNASISPTSNINVSWTGAQVGTIDIVITSMAGDSVYFVQTANDGSHIIPNAELSNPSGTCSLILSHYNRNTITAAGYDSRSFIAGRVMHPITITFE